VADRLLPLWDHGRATDGSDWTLSLLGMDSAALYHYRKSEQATEHHLLPLYGLRTKADGSSRLSILGLPPITGGPAWALYERSDSPTSTSERLFPIYQRSHDLTTDATTINVVGMEPVSLFRYHADPDSVVHRLFPLYSYSRDLQQDERSLSAFWLFWRTSSPTVSRTSLFPLASWSANDATGEHTWSLIGLDPAAPVSWIRHSHGPNHAKGLFAPLYDYEREGDRTALSIGGISNLALYRSEDSPTDHGHRLFPLYRYRHNLVQDSSWLNVLLAYQQERSPDHASDALYPLWQYERRTHREESRFNALGIGRLSLYDHHREPGRTSDRLFPLYRYTANHDTDEKDFSLLWPLIDYKSRQGAVTSASLLWWLISYDHPDMNHFSYYVFGGSKMAMVRRVISPHESLLEINPVIPLYRYRSETAGGRSWDVFYGLVGADSTRDRARVTLLWVSL
jgi:hypothetical protein